MSIDYKSFEKTLKYYNLRIFSEINELISNKNLDLHISSFINIVFNEVKQKQPNFYFNNDKNLMGYTYFFIARYLIEKYDNEKNNFISARSFLSNYYESNWQRFSLNKDWNKEDGKISFIENGQKIIKKLTNNNPIYINKLAKSIQQPTNFKKSNIFSRQNIKELNAVFTYYINNKTNNIYTKLVNNRLKNIKFLDYAKYINYFKEDIINTNDKFKNIRLYLLERSLNFEIIKEICATLHQINELNDSIESYLIEKFNTTENLINAPKIFKRNIQKDLLLVADIPDIVSRISYCHSYAYLESLDELNDWRKRINILIYEAYPLFEMYSIYLIENTYTKAEIKKLIEHECEFAKFIYMNDNLLNKDFNYVDDAIINYAKKDYHSHYKLGVDFSEEDFQKVMAAFQEENSINIIRKMGYDMLEDLKNNKHIPDILKNYTKKNLQSFIYYNTHEESNYIFDSPFIYLKLKPIINYIENSLNL